MPKTNNTIKYFVRTAKTGALLAALFAAALTCKGQPPALESDFAGGNVSAMNKRLSPEAEDLVRRGIGYHDRDDYETALSYYTQAMELAPEHPVICYEMAFSYMALDNPEAALEMADLGIASAQAMDYAEVIPTLLDLKGSALDNLGRSEEALDVYYTAINQYGASNTFLYYNLGVSYYRLDRRAEAAEALVKGLLINPNHPSSNFLLGRLCMEEGKKTQAFYALSYFLLLEPNTERSATSYNTIFHMLEREESIGVKNNGTFTASDMVISLAFTVDEANIGKSDAEKTRAKLYYIFTSLEEQKKSGKIGRSKGDELWWDFYSPFFYRIASSDYFGTFCRYIGLSSDPEAEAWIENGRDEIEGFFTWLNEWENLPD